MRVIHRVRYCSWKFPGLPAPGMKNFSRIFGVKKLESEKNLGRVSSNAGKKRSILLPGLFSDSRIC